jgi:hypothetical protein
MEAHAPILKNFAWGAKWFIYRGNLLLFGHFAIFGAQWTELLGTYILYWLLG